MLPLHILASLNKDEISRVLKISLASAAALLVCYCYLQHVALKNAELVYRNPVKIERIRRVRVTGPVRVVTRVVESAGRKETTTEETREFVFEKIDRDSVSEPVFPPAPRSDRWLIGASLDPFSYGDADEWRGYLGYGFRNRVDLCAGISGRGRPQILVILRF